MSPARHTLTTVLFGLGVLGAFRITGNDLWAILWRGALLGIALIALDERYELRRKSDAP